MAICNSCGGVLGRDCFNPQECAWITQQMQYDGSSEIESLKHELNQANSAILTLQLANEQLQHELDIASNKLLTP